MPRIGAHGFLEFKSLGSDAWLRIDIEVIIKLESESGLILFNGDRPDGIGDYISLAVKNGLVEFSYDCGTGPSLIR